MPIQNTAQRGALDPWAEQKEGGEGWLREEQRRNEYGQQEGAYRDRMQAAGAHEQARLEDLERRNAAALQAQRAQQGQLATRDARGAGIAAGGAGGMRGGSYGATAARGQVGREAELQAILERQAFQKGEVDLYGRQGDYMLSAADVGSRLEQMRMAEQAAMKEKAAAKHANDLANAQAAVGIGMGIGSAGISAASDRDLKTHIREASKSEKLEAAQALSGTSAEAAELGAALDTEAAGVYSELADLPTYSYEYEPQIQDSPIAGEGERFGHMAQDLEGTRLGASMVEDTPAGKVVDTNAASMGALGMAGEAYDKAEGLEERLRAAGLLEGVY